MNDTTGCVLALDQGGQSSRALVFDARGDVLAEAAVAVSEQKHGEERVEQDPEELVASLRAAADEALRSLGAHEVEACGLATQRSSLVCWDRASGRALTPVLSWQDRRAAAWLERFQPQAAEIERRTGLRLSPHYGASKLAWCLEHVEAVRAARTRGTLACGPLASFLAFRLLEERPFVADPANASRTLLVELETGDWDPWLLALFGIPREVLPARADSRSAFGTLVCGALRLPLTVLTGDQSAALFAWGEPRGDTLYVNLGTGAFAQRPLGAPRRAEGLLTSVVLRAAGSATFVLEGTVNGAGSALKAIGVELGVDDPVAACERGLARTGELPLFLNGVSGLAAPFWRHDFASRFVGEGDAEARLAAVAESVLFLLLEIEGALRPVLGAPRQLCASGGLAQSDALCQRLADLAARPVERPAGIEATARGLAELVRGRTASAAAATTRFTPRREALVEQRHARWRAALAEALGLRDRP